jgi:hypothetical protein
VPKELGGTCECKEGCIGPVYSKDAMMAALHATAVADNTHLEMTVAARDKVAQRAQCT